MKRKIHESIEIPAGMNIEAEGQVLKMQKEGKTLEKKLPFTVKKEGNQIVITMDKATKKEKKLIKTARAHVNNMISGFEKKYVYKMQICAVHFPITAKVAGQELIIKNFLGEVKDRKAKLSPEVTVKVDKDIITIEGLDKDKVGQTAASIENAARIVKKDRRIFQDGIFIIEKEKGVRK